MVATTGSAPMEQAADAAARRAQDFETWMVARQRRLLQVAWLLSGDAHTAEDLVQTTLAKLYLAWHRIDPGNVDAYARRVLVNEHHSLWRRPWRRREVSAEDLSGWTPPVVDEQYDGTGAILWTQVRALPPRQRAVIVLRYYEQLTEAETAAVLGVSVGTVKSQASRAIGTLRQRLAEAGHDTSMIGDRTEEQR